MKYIVAVSGGVDSVVLLDTLVNEPDTQIIVAHFDHGTRPESAEDAAFVRDLAAKYNLRFETKREELGAEVSEAEARERRYAFLQSLAKKHEAMIVTAHHLDDLVETVAINLTRGTGWRGLAVFHPTIRRPFLDKTKQELIQYAKRNGLPWREDSTNASDKYLRNRIRVRALGLSEDEKRQLRALHARQRELRDEIAAEINQLIGKGPEYSRYMFTHLPHKVAVEALRTLTKRQLTRPQLERLLHAVKTKKAGTLYEAGGGIIVHFAPRYFTL